MYMCVDVNTYIILEHKAELCFCNTGMCAELHKDTLHAFNHQCTTFNHLHALVLQVPVQGGLALPHSLSE